MKYMGSKRRIAKHILPIMLKEAEKHGITTWVEPFVGGGNMIDKIPDAYKRIGFDINPHTICAMIDVRDRPLLLPDIVSEEEFKSYKDRPPEKITSWVRSACAYGGLFGNVLARGSGRNYAQEAKNNAIKQSPLIQEVDFICDSYANLSFNNCLIYCDPPYKDTSKYKTESFDYEKFYNWCREQSKCNIVFISEYNMPDDFKEVWSGNIKTNFSSSRKKATHNAVEKLFTI